MSQKEKTTIILSGVNENVHNVLEKAGFYELLGKENICPNINVALERAKSLVENAVYQLLASYIYRAYWTYRSNVLGIYDLRVGSICPTRKLYIVYLINRHLTRLKNNPRLCVALHTCLACLTPASLHQKRFSMSVPVSHEMQDKLPDLWRSHVHNGPVCLPVSMTGFL